MSVTGADVRAEWDAKARAVPKETRQKFLDAVWEGKTLGQAMRATGLTRDEALGLLELNIENSHGFRMTEIPDRLAQLKRTHAEIVGSDGGECQLMADVRWACEEIERLRAALSLQATPLVLMTHIDGEIDWEHIIREVNRRQKLAEEALKQL